MLEYYIKFETVTGREFQYKVKTLEDNKGILEYFTNIYLIPKNSNIIIEKWSQFHDLFIKNINDIITI